MDTNEVLSLIGKPAGAALQYRAVLPSSSDIAGLVRSFANADGGHLILGVVEVDGVYVASGISEDFRIEAILEKAVASLSPSVEVRHRSILYKGKRLYAIRVERSSVPIGISGGEPLASSDATSSGSVIYCWVHVSDIHFGHGDASHGSDQQLVMNDILADVGTSRTRGVPGPDAILVTGDIAFSGDSRPPLGGGASHEYEDARRFLVELGQRVGLDEKRIFVVPGNHDVQRPADSGRSVRRLRDSLRDGREVFDDALASAEDRALLAARQAHYLAFAAMFAPACLDVDGLGGTETSLWWGHRERSRAGLKIRLIGLNSALLAADDHDRGKLALGKMPLAQLLTAPPVDPDEFVVVLSHHPLRGGWLRDESDIDSWVRKHAHLHLHGHLHEADSEEERSGAGGAFVRVAAGAAHGEQGGAAAHGYNIAAVVRLPSGELRLRLWPRRWSAKNKVFRSDVDNMPEGAAFAEHSLRLRWA